VCSALLTHVRLFTPLAFNNTLSPQSNCQKLLLVSTMLKARCWVQGASGEQVIV